MTAGPPALHHAPDDAPRPSGEPASDRAPTQPDEPRPLIERIGLAAIAVVITALFAGMGLASLVGGEPFLAAMAGLGALMTAWVGLVTLVRS